MFFFYYTYRPFQNAGHMSGNEFLGMLLLIAAIMGVGYLLLRLIHLVFKSKSETIEDEDEEIDEQFIEAAVKETIAQIRKG